MELSPKAQNVINNWSDYRVPVSRPDFDECFIKMAIEVSKRSHDSQTQHGCVLVKDNRPIMTGYNGFVRDIDDSVLPNVRPLKYDFMMHAESNCLFSCARHGISTVDAIAYITCEPCLNCLQSLWQAGIKKIVHYNWTAKIIDEEMLIKKEIIMGLIGNRMTIDVYNNNIGT